MPLCLRAIPQWIPRLWSPKGGSKEVSSDCTLLPRYPSQLQRLDWPPAALSPPPRSTGPRLMLSPLSATRRPGVPHPLGRPPLLASPPVDTGLTPSPPSPPPHPVSPSLTFLGLRHPLQLPVRPSPPPTAGSATSHLWTSGRRTGHLKPTARNPTVGSPPRRHLPTRLPTPVRWRPPSPRLLCHREYACGPRPTRRTTLGPARYLVHQPLPPRCGSLHRPLSTPSLWRSRPMPLPLGTIHLLWPTSPQK